MTRTEQPKGVLLAVAKAEFRSQDDLLHGRGSTVRVGQRALGEPRIPTRALVVGSGASCCGGLRERGVVARPDRPGARWCPLGLRSEFWGALSPGSAESALDARRRARGGVTPGFAANGDPRAPMTGSDGRLWFADAGGVERLNPDATVSRVSFPSLRVSALAAERAAASGSRGALTPSGTDSSAWIPTVP